MDPIKKKAAANSRRTMSTTSAKSIAGAERNLQFSIVDDLIRNNEMAGPSRSSSTLSTVIKRPLNDGELISALFEFPSIKKPKNLIEGPLYEKRADSIVLYEAESGKEYDADNNPDGYVDVIVSPLIQKANKMSLTPDQIDGLRFLWKSFTEKKGAILAHEMGLGKTRTIISFLCTLLEQSNRSSRRSTPSVQKIIILAPKNAILNTWGDEFSKWCLNHIRNKNTYIYPHDTTDKAIKSIEDFEKQNSMKILLLSYDSFIKYALHFDKYKKAVDVVICDEAHLLKNNLTKRSVVLKKFKSTLWYGITGTPFQNTLEEFCNLVAFFSPRTLPEKYKEDYCRPIERHLKKYGQLDDSVTEHFEALKNMVSNVVQYKQNDIPVDKHELIVCINLKGKAEQDVANRQTQHDLYQMLSDSFIDEKQTINFYQEIDLLKKLCIHPENAFNSDSFKKIACFEEAIELYTKREESRENLNIEAGRNDPEVNSACCSLLYSAKLTTLFKMLHNIKKKKPKEKAIAVSNSIELLNHIEKICKTIMHFNFARYDGETNEKAREHALKIFNTDGNCFILLLSCKAGGTALNLTRANHMFLMDPDWNPSNDKQALGRIYRHGQERTVFTYRFLCTGTIEENILLNQLSKEEMERYLKQKTPTSKLSLPFAKKDLLDYNPETMSHLSDKLSTLYGEETEKFVNDTNKPWNPKNDYELQFFADELSRAATYENEEAIPLEDLSALEDAWASGISFIFHKTKLSKDSIENIEKGIIKMVSLPPLNVKVAALTSQDLRRRNEKCYVLRKEKETPKGLVLIVNNKHYSINSEGNPVENPKDSDYYREHSEIDVRNVRSVFRQMGYLVIIKEDVKGSEMNQVVEEFKTELKEKVADVALIFLMGYGANNDNFIMVDGSPVNVWTEVIRKFNFDSFPEMEGKPKGFFLSFCQTDLKGIEQVKPSSPLNDIIVSQATSPGKVAYGLDKSGSMYIHKLVEIIMKKSHNRHLVKMLEKLQTKMSGLVVDVQIPKFQSYLRKKLYLI